MKILAFVLFLILFCPFVMADSMMEDFVGEAGEPIESHYNVQTMITKERAYIILETDRPGECE